MDAEKRKFTRIKKQVDAQYRRVGTDKAIWITISVNDISASGAYILIDRFPLIGEDILLRLRLPSDPNEWIQIKAKVLDVDKSSGKTYLARLQFIDLESEYQNRINEYIDFYLKRENSR
jgi:hypothetical protein